MMNRIFGLAILAAVSLSPAMGTAEAHAATGAEVADDRSIYVSRDDAEKPWHQGWADARVSGDFVFVSGVVVSSDAADPANLELAFSRAFERIEAVLRLSGSSMADVSDITAYLTDVSTQTAALDKARLQYMKPPYAASTVVQVVRLIPAKAIGELRVVAQVGK